MKELQGTTRRSLKRCCFGRSEIDAHAFLDLMFPLLQRETAVTFHKVNQLMFIAGFGVKLFA